MIKSQSEEMMVIKEAKDVEIQKHKDTSKSLNCQLQEMKTRYQRDVDQLESQIGVMKE